MFNGKIPYIRVGKGRHGKYLISKEGLLQYFYRLNEKVGKWIERERGSALRRSSDEAHWSEQQDLHLQ